MDIKKSKFDGFLQLPRELNSKLFTGELTFNEFGLLLILVMNADWDSRHKAYRKVLISNSKLGTIEGLDRNKVAKLKKFLIKKKIIELIGKKEAIEIIRIFDFEKYQAKIDWKMATLLKDIEE